MLFSKGPKKIWNIGDFVQITAEETQYGILDHAGEVGVIIFQIAPTTNKDSAAYGHGWYNHVWFGPYQEPALKRAAEIVGIDIRNNWRGYDDTDLKEVTWKTFVKGYGPGSATS